MISFKNFKFKKKFGQNFLEDLNYLEYIVDSCDIDKQTSVIEIGPGNGELTSLILNEAGELKVIEVDDDLVPILKGRFKGVSSFSLIHKDVMEIDLDLLEFKYKKIVVVGSLPYNISKPIIAKFLESDLDIAKIIFLVQKEVALDYAAKSPNSSFLSNFASVFADVNYLKSVPKELFHPKPKVDGGIIEFIPYKNKPIYALKLISFIKRFFQNPRKILANNIASGLKVEKQKILDIMKSCSLEERSRAENLSLQDWNNLYQKLENV